MDKYGWSAGELHILREPNETWCGGYVTETYSDHESAKKEHGHFGTISTCTDCLQTKHATDSAKGTTEICTTGTQP